MSTEGYTFPRTSPLLPEGLRLDRPTFHRLYEQTHPDFRAELINGVVCLPGRVSARHGTASAEALFWLAAYAMETRGVHGLARTTILLDDRSEIEPNATLLIRPECGGQSHVEGDYIAGPPELVMEVADDSRYVDLGPKRDVYEQVGIREYIVIAFNPDEVIWHVRQNGAFTQVQPDPDGLYRSKTFPGLWLDPAALIQGDTRRLREVVAQGTATRAHTAFLTRLTEKKSANA